jgi:hypothetical protein
MLIYQGLCIEHYIVGAVSNRMFMDRTSPLSFVTVKSLYSRSASTPRNNAAALPAWNAACPAGITTLLNVISQTALPFTLEDSISSRRIFAVPSRSGRLLR